MTRAEYEAKYGTKAPVATSTAPVQMTRAEYETKYGNPLKDEPGIVRQIAGSITKPFEKLSATAQKFGGGAVAYGLDKITPGKQTYTSFKDATQKVGSGYDKGAFSATKSLTGETPQPVKNLRDLAGTSLEAASVVAPVVKAPAFLSKVVKGKIGAAAVEGGLTAGTSGLIGGTGRGLQEGKDVVGSLERGVVEGAIAAPLGLALGGIAGGLVRAPKLATKSGRQQVALQSAKEQFSKDLEDVLSTKSLSKSVSDLEKANVPVRDILNDIEVAQGIKVVNKAINVDDAVSVTQKNLDRAQNAKAKLLPEIDKFAPKVSKEEVRRAAIEDILGKETVLDEKNLIARINNQVDALDDNLSLQQIDAERRRFYNSGRTAKGEQRSDSEYAAIENALRKVLFDKTDNLPQGIDTNGEIKGLNTYIRQQLKAQDFLDKKLRGQTVKGGKLGEYFARGIGAVAGSQGGVLGSLAGSEIAGYVSNVLTNNKLGSSVKMRLIREAAEETADSQIIKAANELIKKLQSKPQLQLPAPSTGFKSVIPGQETIKVGPQTVDELPAQKINRSQSQPSISRQNVANKTITMNPNASITSKLPQNLETSRKLSTYYHGTSAPEFNSFKDGVVYLTRDPAEAGSFAKNEIIGGGRMKGTPRTLEVSVPEGKTMDINEAVQDVIMEDGNLDDVIAKAAVDARKNGYEFLSFTHPGSKGNDFEAIVAVNPQKLGINKKSALPKEKGIVATAIENLKNPSKRQGGYIRLPGAKKELPVSKSSSVNSTTDLLSEAKKYKSAEEFASVPGIEPERVKKMTLFGSQAEGKATAKSDIDILVSVEDGPMRPKIIKKGNIGFMVADESYYDELLKVVRKEGVVMKDNRGIVKTLTKSQLADIWKQSQGKK